MVASVDHGQPTKAMVQHDRDDKVSGILFEIADTMEMGPIAANYRPALMKAVSVASRIGRQILRQIVQILSSLGRYSLDAVQGAAPIVGSIASKLGSLVGNVGGTTMSSVAGAVRDFLTKSWVVSVIAAMFVFRYVYNSCFGLGSADMDEVTSDATALIHTVIESVAPWGVSGVLSFCVSSVTSALRMSLLPIRVALGPIVHICSLVSRDQQRVYKQNVQQSTVDAVLAEKRSLNLMKQEDAKTAVVVQEYLDNAETLKQKMRLDRAAYEAKVRAQDENELIQQQQLDERIVEMKSRRQALENQILDQKHQEKFDQQRRSMAEEAAFRRKDGVFHNMWGIGGILKTVGIDDPTGYTPAEREQAIHDAKQKARFDEALPRNESWYTMFNTANSTNSTNPTNSTNSTKSTNSTNISGPVKKRPDVGLSGWLSPSLFLHDDGWRQTAKFQREVGSVSV